MAGEKALKPDLSGDSVDVRPGAEGRRTRTGGHRHSVGQRAGPQAEESAAAAPASRSCPASPPPGESGADSLPLKTLREWRATFDAICDPICLLDPHGRILRCNKAMAALVGRTKGEIVGRSCCEEVHAGAGIPHECPLIRTLGSLKSESERLLIRGRWYSVTTDPLLDEDGGLMACVHVMTDITNRTRAEDALRDNLRFLEALVENSPSLTVLSGADGRIIMFSRTCEKLTGYSKREALGARVAEFLAPAEWRSRASGMFTAVAPGGTPSPMECPWITKSGDTVLIEWRFTALSSPNGAENYVLASGADVTRRERAREALREEHEFIAAVLDTSSALVIVLDQGGRIVRFNKACEQLTGRAFEDVRGAHVKNFLLSEESWEEMRRAFSAVPDEGPSKERETLWLTSSGSERIVEWRWSRLQSQGEGDFVVLTGTDRTRHRRMERQLVQTEKLSALGHLIAGVAHELNNPLTGVMGYSEILSDALGSLPKARRDLKAIQRNAMRCKSIVENLLRFARQHEPERKPLAITDVLEATIQLMSYQFRTAKIEISTDYAESLGLVEADFNQIQQVFVNLMTNAAQAMSDGGGGDLIVRTVPHDDCVRVKIIDDGPGISRQHLSRIFDTFFTTKDTGAGTGLGLSVCYGIVTAHHGRIWADSKPGCGATFVVELPVSSRACDPAESKPTSTRVLARRQRVLVVEDEAAVSDVLERILGSFGLQVSTAFDGRQALEFIAESTPDMILCDLHMPRMDGMEFYATLASRQPELAQRVVFCTGDTVSGEAHDFLQRTRRPVVSKPFDITELSQVVAAEQERTADINVSVHP